MGIYRLKGVSTSMNLSTLIGIMGSGFVLSGAYIAYMACTKPDIRLRPSQWKQQGAPYNELAPGEIRKLVPNWSGMVVPVNQELDTLRRELGDYKTHK